VSDDLGAAVHKAARVSARKPSILLVDDDFDIVQTFKMGLETRYGKSFSVYRSSS
jgi:hypothetical protein